jgi:O-antigen biosynthesis protein
MHQTSPASTWGDTPPASLIIPSRNRPEMLAEAVASALRGNRVPAEIVVVDQSEAPHPSLATLTTDRPCQVRYLHARSVGVSRARNTGIAAAHYAILAFIDDDIVATPDWFGSLVGALIGAGPRAVVTGQVLASPADPPAGFAPSTRGDRAPAVYQGRIGGDVLLGGNMALYRSAIEEVGAFDESLGPGTGFPAAEDIDLGYRLLEAGYCTVYVPEAVVYHRAWRTQADYVPLWWRYGRGQGAYYAKHFGTGDLHLLGRMRSDMWRHLHRLPRRVWRLEGKLACRDVVYVLGLVVGAGQWLLRKRGSP